MKLVFARLGWLTVHAGLLVAAACGRDSDPRDASKTGTAQLTPATPAPAAQSQAAAPPTPPDTSSGAPSAAERAQPTPPPPSKGATAVVGQARLVLRDCRLEADWSGGERQTKDIDLPGGCAFVTTPSGAQVVKTDQGDALLVVSSRPLQGRPGDCDTRVRAVVLKGDRLIVSSEEQVMRMCGADGPFDSILFHTLAASAKG